jgi:hypothetical protein
MGLPFSRTFTNIISPYVLHQHTLFPFIDCCCRSGHMGLRPSSTQLSHLLAAAGSSGELKQLPCMAQSSHGL